MVVVITIKKPTPHTSAKGSNTTPVTFCTSAALVCRVGAREDLRLVTTAHLCKRAAFPVSLREGTKNDLVWSVLQARGCTYINYVVFRYLGAAGSARWHWSDAIDMIKHESRLQKRLSHHKCTLNKNDVLKKQ